MNTTLHAVEPPLAETMEDFFRTKTSCDVAGTMSFFSPDLATYTDATLGWDIDSFEALHATLLQVPWPSIRASTDDRTPRHPYLPEQNGPNGAAGAGSGGRNDARTGNHDDHWS